MGEILQLKRIFCFFSISCVLRIYNSSRREQASKLQREHHPFNLKTSQV